MKEFDERFFLQNGKIWCIITVYKILYAVFLYLFKIFYNQHIRRKFLPKQSIVSKSKRKEFILRAGKLCKKEMTARKLTKKQKKYCKI